MNSRKVLSLFTQNVLIFLVIYIQRNGVSCSNFGNSCSTPEDCSENWKYSGMTCNNGNCSCLPLNVPLQYNFIEKGCRINLGDKCASDNETFHRFCPEGSICMPSKFSARNHSISRESAIPRCHCLGGVSHLDLETNIRYCKPFQEIGETCDDENPCDDSAQVHCTNQRCQCSLGEENMFFDDKSHRCISSLDKRCFHSTCNTNAQCVQPSGEVCSEFDECSFGICKCMAGYTPNNEGICLRSYGQSCDSTIESKRCNHDELLNCLNGFCLCENPMSLTFHNRTGETKCLSLVGQKCADMPRNVSRRMHCVENSVCNNGICECEKNFVKTPHNNCLLGYEETCSHDQKLCNYFSGLGCKDGLCKCFDPNLKYDHVTSHCVSGKGSLCGRIKIDHEHVPVFYAHCNNTAQSVCVQDKWGEMSFCT